jgi:hypothetical protein
MAKQMAKSCRAKVPYLRHPETGSTVLRLLLVFLLLASPLLGQNSNVSAAAGTRLRVEFASVVGTESSRINDGVEVHLLKAVIVGNHELLPAGTILFGRVLAVQKGATSTRIRIPCCDLPSTRPHFLTDAKFLSRLHWLT